jgi:hypothetical protein
MPDRPYAYFGVFGSRASSFDPADFSARSGVTATTLRRKGDLVGRTTARVDYWEFAADREMDLAEQIAYLTHQISGARFSGGGEGLPPRMRCTLSIRCLDRPGTK